jgi:hypothetical protein
MRIIGICGAKRSGKDTTANILAAKLEAVGLTVSRVAFADCIRTAATALCTYKEMTTDLKDVVKASIGMTPRQVLIAIGQALREINPNVWISLTAERLNRFEAEGVDVAIITDVRQENEVRWLLQRVGNLLIYIKRPGFKASQEDPNDPNESPGKVLNYVLSDDLELWQQVTVIHNEATIVDLMDGVDRFIDKYELLED